MAEMRRVRRTDADRRVLQCARLGRLLRLLNLIMGGGRWDANSLAEELSCSRRTVFRLFQTLSYAGVPWYFDEAKKAYRVRPGFKFLSLDEVPDPNANQINDLKKSLAKILQDGEEFLSTLKVLIANLEHH